MELSNHIEYILGKQKSLEYEFYKILRPRADELLVANTEQELDIQFNDDLIELYSFANGALCRTERSDLLCLIPFYDFLTLRHAVDYHKSVIDNNPYFYNSEKNYNPGKKLFPFLEQDGGDCYWVDLNKGTENYNKIYWTTTLAQEPDYLFNSLESMFRTIAECYEQNILFLDKENILSCDHESWGIVAQKNNPNLDYWELYNNPA